MITTTCKPERKRAAQIREHAGALATEWDRSGKKPCAGVLRTTLGCGVSGTRDGAPLMRVWAQVESADMLRELGGLCAHTTAHDTIPGVTDGPVMHYPSDVCFVYDESNSRPIVSPVRLTEPTPPPDDEPTIDEVLDAMEAEYTRLHANREARKVRTVRVDGAGPVGVLLVGDPHVDDPGADVGQLRRDLEAVKQSPGCWGLCVGDVSNNWVGRLVKLYAHQSVTQERALRLARWMLAACPWLGVVHGNHDNWNDGWMILKYLTEAADVTARARHDLRISLVWPDGEAIRIHARHDFPGHSWFNPTHGLDKRSLLDPWADLLVCGHKHVSHISTGPKLEGYGWRKAIRVAGYKRHDTYADEKGFVPREHEPSCLVILDPHARRPADRVREWWDVQAGCAEVARLRGGA